MTEPRRESDPLLAEINRIWREAKSEDEAIAEVGSLMDWLGAEG